MKAAAHKRRRRVVRDEGPDPIDVFVGRRMRERRLQEGLSQTALAEQLGVCFQAVQKYKPLVTAFRQAPCFGLVRRSVSRRATSSKATRVPLRSAPGSRSCGGRRWQRRRLTPRYPYAPRRLRGV